MVGEGLLAGSELSVASTCLPSPFNVISARYRNSSRKANSAQGPEDRGGLSSGIEVHHS